MADEVQIDDLLGLRYEEGAYTAAAGALDCAGAVLEVLRRAGLREARSDFLRAIKQGVGSAWQRIDDLGAARVGDVFVQEGGGEIHVSAVFALDPTRALTSTRKAGVRVARLAMLSDGALYRFSGTTAVAPIQPVRAVFIPNMLDRGAREIASVAPGRTVGDLLEERGWRGAIRLTVNGAKATRKTVLASGDIVVAIRVPEGFDPVTVGINILISIAISVTFSLLFPPPKIARRRDDESSPTYSFNGISTNRSPGQPIPVGYGRLPLGGTIINEYIETIGVPPRTYYRGLIALGEGPFEDIAGLTEDTPQTSPLVGGQIPDGIEINGNSASNIDGVKVWVRLGTNQQDAIPGFDEIRQAFPVDLNLDAQTTSGDDPSGYSGGFDPSAPFDSTNDSVWSTYGETYDFDGEADGCVITLDFPQGFARQNTTTGAREGIGVAFQVRYIELDGAGSPITSGGPNSDGYARLPVVGPIAFARTTPFQYQIRQDFFDISSYQPTELGACANYFGSSGTIAHAVGSSMPYVDGQDVSRFSISVWFKLATNPTGTVTLVSTYSSVGDDQGFELRIEEEAILTPGAPSPSRYRLIFQIGTDDGDTVRTIASSAFGGIAEGIFDDAADQWVHVGVAYQRNEAVALTVNGSVIATTLRLAIGGLAVPVSRNDLAWNRAALTIGDGSTLLQIDDLKLYDATLTPAALRGEYNGGIGTTNAAVPDPSLLVFYNDFEEAGGGEDQSGSGWWATSGSITGDVTTGAVDGVVQGSPSAELKRARYRVEVMRVTQESTAANVQNEVTFDAIQSIVSERLVYPNVALVGFEVEATDQLNDQIPQLTAISWQQKGLVWDGVSTVAPSLRREKTANPAWLALALILDRRLGLGGQYRASQIDLPQFRDWAAYCDQVVYDGFRRVTVSNPPASGDALDVYYDSSTADPTTGVTRGELRFEIAQAQEGTLPSGFLVGKFLRLVGWPDEGATGDVDINSPDGEGYEVFSVALVDGNWIIRTYFDRLDEGDAWTSGNYLGADELSDTTAYNDATIEGGERRFECHIVFDDRGKAWERLLDICATGRGMPVPVGQRLSVRYSAPRDPVGVITPDNIIEGSFQVDYASPATRPNVYTFQILDASEEYEQNPVTVPDEGLSTAGDQSSIRQENADLRGVTSPGQAERHGKHLLAINRNQIRSGEFEVALDGLAYTVGDVLRVSSDVLPRGFASRVAANSAERQANLLEDADDLDGAAWTTTGMTVTTGSSTSIYGGDDAQTIDGGSAVQALAPNNRAEGWYTVSGFARSVGAVADDVLLVSLAQDRGTPTVTLDLIARTAAVTAGDPFETPAVARAQATSGTWMFFSASFYAKRSEANAEPQTLTFSIIPLTDSGAELSSLVITQAELPAVDNTGSGVRGVLLEDEVTIAAASSQSVYVQDGRGSLVSSSVDGTLTPDGSYGRGDVIFVSSAFATAPIRGNPVIVSGASDQLLVEIADIARAPDLSARVSWVEYRSEPFSDGLEDGVRELGIATGGGAGPGTGPSAAPDLALPAPPSSFTARTSSVSGPSGGALTQLVAAWDVPEGSRDRVTGAALYGRPQAGSTPGGWELIGTASGDARDLEVILPASLEGGVIELSLALLSRAWPSAVPERGARTAVLAAAPAWQPAAPSALDVQQADFKATYTATLPDVAPRIAAARVVEFRRGGASWILSHLIGRSLPGEDSITTSDVFQPVTGSECATVQARIILPTGAVSDAATDATALALPLSDEAPSTYQGAATEWESATSTTWFVEPPTANRPTQTGFTITGGNALEFDTGETNATFTTNEPGTVGDTDADTATLELDRVPRRLYLGASFEATQAHPSDPSDYGYASGDINDSRWVSEGPLWPLGNEPENAKVWIEVRINSDGTNSGWSGWRRFHCGIYSAVDVQFRLRATRPSTDFQVAITKFHTRVGIPAPDFMSHSFRDLSLRAEML